MSVVEGQSAEFYPIYVAGKFTSTAQHLDVVNPYSGQCVYRTCLAGDAEFEEAVSAACAVRRTLRDLPVYRRWQILMEVSEALHDQRQELALIMAREAAKPLKTALGEVDRAVQTFLIAAQACRYLVIDFGTSKSPKSTRQRDNHYCPGRPASVPLHHTFVNSALATQHSLK